VQEGARCALGGVNLFFLRNYKIVQFVFLCRTDSNCLQDIVDFKSGTNLNIVRIRLFCADCVVCSLSA